MADTRKTWSSRIGFVLASAGAAVGLGAIWKFPYMVGTNGGSAFVSPAGGIIRFGSGQSFIPEARPDLERPATPRRTVQIPIAIRPLQPRKAQPQEPDKPERVWVKGHWRYTRDRDGNIISRTWVTGHWQDEKPAVRDTP